MKRTTEEATFDCHLYGELCKDDKFSFLYIAATFQKRTKEVYNVLQTRYPLMYTVRYSSLQPVIAHREGIPTR
jgi:hypothetical protein